MQTDAVFYELFNVSPSSVFRLVQLELEGEYSFESVTVKSTEKRLDGLCRRIDGTGPNVFVEIQGYDDPKIYWRVLREVATYYEQHDDSRPFLIIVLFLDPKHAPETCPLSTIVAPNQCVIAHLRPCLKAVGKHAGALTVLKPFACTRKTQVFEEVRAWKHELESLSLPDEKIHILRDLLAYVIVQKFPSITRKEIETMLQLTPIEDTVIGKELKQIWTREGRQEGEKRGVTKGELIGEIRALQKVLKQPVTPVKHLIPRGLKTLRTILEELEAEVAKVL